MPHLPLSERVIIDLAVRERGPGEEAFDTIQWQIPSALMRVFQREARQRGIDVTSLLRDIIGTALTERAEALRRHTQDATTDAAPLQAVNPGPGPLPATVPSTFPAPPADVQSNAQELIYQAWEAPTRAEERRLAEQALALWPDCADAYNVFAAQARSLAEQYRQYERALAAGERALGPALFAQEHGNFWLVLETRPYMRARHGLAITLWALGEHEAAIAQLWAMLDLNPMDNQGMRYLLSTWLLAENDAAGLDRLLAQYPDEWSANLAYTTALHRFRQAGPGRPATKALRYALQVNAHVPAYLLGEKPLPITLPEYIGLGDEREAEAYAADTKALWDATVGATAWLAAISRQAPRRPH